MRTKQETFDRVVAYARTMTKKSVEKRLSPFVGGETLACRYRVFEGDRVVNKCFVGDLIPSDQYDVSMEGKLAGLIMGHHPELIPFLGDSRQLIGELQRTHDGLPMTMWEARFKIIAANYGLTYTPPQAASDVEQNQPEQLVEVTI